MKENILNNDAITLLIGKYQQLKKRIKRIARETAQYWLVYMEMVSQTSSVSICNKHQQFAIAD